MASCGWKYVVVCAAALLFAMMAHCQRVSAVNVDPSVLATLSSLKEEMLRPIFAEDVNTTYDMPGRHLQAAKLCASLATIYTSHSTKYCLGVSSSRAVVQQKCSQPAGSNLNQLWIVTYPPQRGTSALLHTSEVNASRIPAESHVCMMSCDASSLSAYSGCILALIAHASCVLVVCLCRLQSCTDCTSGSNRCNVLGGQRCKQAQWGSHCVAHLQITEKCSIQPNHHPFWDLQRLVSGMWLEESVEVAGSR
jgi:hypothetical protein